MQADMSSICSRNLSWSVPECLVYIPWPQCCPHLLKIIQCRYWKPSYQHISSSLPKLQKLKGLSNEISIASGGSYSYTPVQFPPSRNSFPLKGHSWMPRNQDSQSSSLCFPYLSCSFIFTNGINSFPFPLVTSARYEQQGMETELWLVPVPGPLCCIRR